MKNHRHLLNKPPARHLKRNQSMFNRLTGKVMYDEGDKSLKSTVSIFAAGKNFQTVCLMVCATAKKSSNAKEMCRKTYFRLSWRWVKKPILFFRQRAV